MKKILLLTVMFFVLSNINAQTIPINTCGILYTYDNAGNRIKQEYYCNNSTPRVINAQNDTLVATKAESAKQPENAAFQSVDALYPNPTTGIFYITFSKALQNARVYLSDLNGRVLSQFKGNGNKISFDLSALPNGVYFVHVEDNGSTISKKVIKAN